MKGLLIPVFAFLPLMSASLSLQAQTSGAGEAAAPADTPCKARLDSVTSRGGSRYLPFNPGDVYEQLQVAVTDSTGCRLGFTFRSLNASRMLGDGDALTYELRSSGGRRARLDGETVEPASGWIGATANRFDAFATISSGQAVRPGLYQDRIVIQLVDAGRVLDEREIGLSTMVLPQARVSVGGASAAGFSPLNGGGLDFGDLQTGAQRSAQLFVRANASVAVQLRSDNGSRLRRVGTEQTGVEIPYSVTVGGVAGDLSRPMSMNLAAPAIGGDADAVDLTVRLGTIQDQLAGDYRDTITVDVLVLE